MQPVSQAMPAVRIVVAEPPLPPPDEGPDTVAALQRLGPEARVDVVGDSATCIALCRAGDVDLVVVDRALGSEGQRILEELRRCGPPVVVVGRDIADEAALDAFRRGAAECVAVRADQVELLPVVALEQIQRWRALCERAAAERRIQEIKQLQRQVLQTEKMASIGQLAAGVAHEINNPIAFVHANLSLMGEYLADLGRAWDHVEALQKAVSRGELAEVRRASSELAATAEEADIRYLLSDLAKAIRESQEGSERIRHIVRDLQDFSRQDSAERVLADVNDCLSSTVGIVRPMMKHVVELETDYDEPMQIACYPMQLKQVFLNLLVNGFQAIEERVGDSGEIGHIRVRTARVEGGVTISVSDDGTGIPPDHLGRIFDPFFTTKEVGSGTGLGLSTSFNIVQRHGGTLTAESAPGEGATFRVFLPALAGVEGGRGG
ncbi:MAG: ATP-binding protein [Myxococcota bacterium]